MWADTSIYVNYEKVYEALHQVNESVKYNYFFFEYYFVLNTYSNFALLYSSELLI